MSWFESCKHDWEIKSKEVLPSAAEQMKNIGVFTEKVLTVHFQKKIHILMACKKCGQVYETSEVNP